MYNLGEHFKRDLNKAKALEKNVLKGKKYRITVLTERLVRLEYSETGTFEDRPTEIVASRDFPTPEFKVTDEHGVLKIVTKYFRLTYTKEKPFTGSKLNTTSNLRIELLNTDRIWYYKHPEVRNYGTPGLSTEMEEGKIKFKKGLYSSDGFAAIYDDSGIVFEADGSIEKRASDYVDVYVFLYLKDFAACLKDYFYLTGPPALIPRYALGNWWSRNVGYNDLSLKQLIDQFAEEEIPLSVLVLNHNWHLPNRLGKKDVSSGFTWNHDQFVKPKAMIDYLHSQGIRVGLEIDPEAGLFPTESSYAKVSEYLKPDANGVIPFEVMNPRFLDVYLKLVIHPLDNDGVDFYQISYQNKHDLQSLWLLNHYHFYDMMRDFKRRPLILSRNTLVNPHHYPVLYAGKSIVSWETLKMVPFYNVSAANNGVSFFAHDIGGYYKGIEDNELYTRFVQLGTFSPILKFGSEAGKYYKREPWRWSYKTAKIVKTYLTLRTRLIPYLYAESYKYYKYGMPLIMPVFYKTPEYYDDLRYRNEYYLGTELFVCPIIHKKDYDMNRSVHKFYIPEGTWYDFMTGKKFPGGREYVSFFKDQDYPVFAKAGAIIPLGENDNINDVNPPKNMEIHVFPGQNNQYNLYEDDGVSDLYKRGFYLLTSIEYNYLPNNYTMIIRAIEGKSGIIPATRNYKIRFRNTKKANDVVVYFNSQLLSYKAYIDGPDFVVEVRDVPTIGQLTVNCKGKDIEIDAVRLIGDDIESIISDLELETTMKEKIDHILFSELSIKKKRIEIRKLGRHGLEKRYIKLFLNLLEYIGQV